MKASETRAFAREKLVGKWGKAASATLVFGLIEGIISLITWMFEENSLPSLIMSIINLVITVPISFGFLITMFKLNDDEEISYVGFLNDGFANFKKSWSVTLQTLKKLIVPLTLFIVSYVLIFFSLDKFDLFGSTDDGIVILLFLSIILNLVTLVHLIFKSLSFSLATKILYDNPDISSKEIVEKSAELMKGNIGSYICLKLSFLGWAILTLLPFGPVVFPLGLGIFLHIPFGLGIFWLIPYAKIAEINFYRNLTNE